MTLGEKIQELRRRYSMSQDVLAERLEVSRQAVSKWERDEAMPETDKIIRIAQVFGVTTDYLLREESPLPPPQEPPRRASHRSVWERIERFIRRHGYKAGYALIAWGAILCVIALLVMIFVPMFIGGFPNAGKLPESSQQNGIYIEGDIPQDVLDSIFGQSGSGIFSDPFTDMENMYNQQVDQMSQAWQNGVRILTAVFGIPVMLFGILLITTGVVVIVKGKRLAMQETQ